MAGRHLSRHQHDVKSEVSVACSGRAISPESNGSGFILQSPLLLVVHGPSGLGRGLESSTLSPASALHALMMVMGSAELGAGYEQVTANDTGQNWAWKG